MIEKVLEYQKVESELIKTEIELSKSKDKEKALEIQQVLKNQQARLVALEKSAQKVNASYKKATENSKQMSFLLLEFYLFCLDYSIRLFYHANFTNGFQHIHRKWKGS